MLETLVSSRIRRTLFEHLLTHPTERFYLRGLAKELTLSISPLRRELKRLQGAGMLMPQQEGNILFYTVNTDSPAFLQLRHATVTTPEAPAGPTPATAPIQAAPEVPAAGSPVRPAVITWRSPLSGPVLVGAAVAGMALMIFTAGALYFRMTSQLAQTSRALSAPEGDMAGAVPPSSSGAMHGGRWQLIPGGFGGGGFNSSVRRNTTESL